MGVKDRDIERFLDLEADTESENDDDEEDEYDGDFLDDSDEDPAPFNYSASRVALLLEHERTHSDEEWDALLARARQRAAAQPTHWQHFAEDLEYPSRPLLLWRVAVKPGHEEEVTYRLFNRIIQADATYSTVASVIGSPCRPGWIAVEAPSLEDVQALCHNALNIYPRQIYAIDADATRTWHHEPPMYTPPAGSWVRLRRYPYKNDLAYVISFDIRRWEASILVVPRLVYKSTHKRKRPRAIRPAPALFDIYEAKKWCGEDSVEKRNQVFLFQGKIFEDGYLRLETSDFYFEEAKPATSELSRFESSILVSKASLERGYEQAAARRIVIGNHVKVISGELQGALGVVENILNDEATVELDDIDSKANLSLAVLRTDMRIGDEVVVIAGSNIGMSGWIISTSSDNLQIYVHKLAKEISAAKHEVTWTASLHSPEGGRVGVEVRTKFGPDPHKKILGRHVRVVNVGSEWKGYNGIIKSSLENDEVLVELEATMKQQRIALRNLIFIKAPKTMPPGSSTELVALSAESPLVPSSSSTTPRKVSDKPSSSSTIPHPVQELYSRPPNFCSNFRKQPSAWQQ
ncbi:hypothetical protein H0H81_010541 [Sphagnurus paluster]|uniref:Chromatin elongation factor SPT5 n=1 Tax=Sphagnurus paluster TaxID=117069 RepID=A0A9P7K8F6_9AGAR|nr:hypothetical protein H0H81_010541 [Sphagnurus paluster]